MNNSNNFIFNEIYLKIIPITFYSINYVFEVLSNNILFE